LKFEEKMTVESTKTFSREEVSQRNGKNGADSWIIIRDSIYNVTDFVKMDNHPGSPELVMEFAGKDATKDFENFGHSGDAIKLMKSLKIGELVEEDRKSNLMKSKVIRRESLVETIVKKRRFRKFLLFCG
jgi:cytochrome b involved in lipid metabolism